MCGVNLHRRSRGFTLLEVALGVTILAILAGTMFTIVQSSLQAASDIEVGDQQFVDTLAAGTAPHLVTRRYLRHRERTEDIAHARPIVDRQKELALTTAGIPS